MPRECLSASSPYYIVQNGSVLTLQVLHLFSSNGLYVNFSEFVFDDELSL